MTNTLTNYARTDIANSVVSSAADANQYYFFFGSVSPWQAHFAILDISQSASAEVTVAPGHTIEVGEIVSFTDVTGMTAINGLTGSVTAVVEDLITVTIDTSGYAAYSGGGVVSADRSYVDEVESLETVRRNIAGLKIVTGNDVCHVVPRNDWYYGQIFVAYDPTVDMSGRQFYTYSNGRLYVCLDAGYGVSNRKPTTNRTYPVKYADGYVWLLVQNVDAYDLERFGDASWMPVRPRTEDTTNVGQILAAITASDGVGYLHTDTITIVGDGVGATARIHKFGPAKGIQGIEIVNNGSGYSWADAYITTSTGTGCVIKLFVSPGLGLGVSAVKSLLATHVKFIYEIDGTENDQLYVGAIRSIGMLRQHDSTLTGTVIDTRSKMIIDQNGLGFSVGTKVYGQISGTTGIIAGTTENSIKYLEENGTGFIAGEAISDRISNSAIIKTIDRYDSNSLKNADVIFIDNFSTAYTRNENQLDTFSAVIGY